MFNEFFEIVKVINLDKRADRWQTTEFELDRVGIKAERFSAFDGDNKHRAFNRSQWTVLNECKDYRTMLILEDDVEFKNYFHFQHAVTELPDDWDVLYLGANINGTKLERYSDHLVKIRNSYTTHAVAYSKKMAQWIVENFPYHKEEYEREGLIIYDEWLRVNVQEQFNCFLIAPMIAWQKPGFSDIWQNQADYSRCFEDGNQLLK